MALELDMKGRLNEDKRKTKVQRATRLLWCGVIGVPALLQLFLGQGLTQGDRIASKLALVVLGVILWHLTRSQMFFYYDLKAWTDTIWASDNLQAKALVVVGYCLLFGLLAAGIIIGLSTGL